MGVSCFLHVVQIKVFPNCSLLYRFKYFLCVPCFTDLGVWSEASQDIQHFLLQHSRELLVAGVYVHMCPQAVHVCVYVYMYTCVCVCFI